MWRNGFSGNELNPFGSHQETKQQLQLKHVDSQDDLQVYDEPYRRSLNFQLLERGYKVAQESSSDNEQFEINETHSAWNMPSSSTQSITITIRRQMKIVVLQIITLLAPQVMTMECSKHWTS